METLWIAPEPSTTIAGTPRGRPEGVAFSHDGALVAVAESEAGRVAIYRRRGGAGVYETTPSAVLEGAASGLAYPHDVDFSADDRVLVVANREPPSLRFFVRRPGSGSAFDPRPSLTIAGPRSKLRFTDAVAFVPPHGRFVAAASGSKSSVAFHRRRWWSTRARPRFAVAPTARLRGPAARITFPDGLAFSSDGTLLAVTNHGAHSVTLYARGRRECDFGPAPVAEISGESAQLRFPHSVAFAPGDRTLAVSNGGGRHVAVFRRDGPDLGAWSSKPAFVLEACEPRRYEVTVRVNPQEGGSKGIAFGPGCFAFGCADLGLRIHRMGAR